MQLAELNVEQSSAQTTKKSFIILTSSAAFPKPAVGSGEKQRFGFLLIFPSWF